MRERELCEAKRKLRVAIVFRFQGEKDGKRRIMEGEREMERIGPGSC